MFPDRLLVTLVTGSDGPALERTASRLRDELAGQRVAFVGEALAGPAPGWDVEIAPRIVRRGVGCDYCAFRADLVEVLGALSLGRARPERVVVVDPPGADSVLAVQTFLLDRTLRQRVVLDSVVEAVYGPAISTLAAEIPGPAPDANLHVGPSPWASDVVIEGAGRLTDDGARRVEAFLSMRAPLARLCRGDDALPRLTGAGLLVPAALPAILERVSRQGGPVVEIDGSLDSAAVEQVLRDLVKRHAPRLRLALASLCIADHPGSYTLHAARSVAATGLQVEAAGDISRLLVIGDGIDPAAWRNELDGVAS